MEEENKNLLTNLNSINDINFHQFIQSKQSRIIKKTQQQNLKKIAPNLYPQYFGDFEDSRPNLLVL